MKKLQFILYKIFIIENRYDARKMAERVGVSASTFYKWCEGIHEPSLKAVRQIFFATGDREILEALLYDTGFTVVKKIEGQLSGKDIQDELLDNHGSLSAIHLALREAMQDGNLTKKELRNLQNLAEVNYKEAAEIVMVFKALEGE